MPLSCYVPSQIIPKSRVVHLADKQILKRHILSYPKIIVSKNSPGEGRGRVSIPGLAHGLCLRFIYSFVSNIRWCISCSFAHVLLLGLKVCSVGVIRMCKALVTTCQYCVKLACIIVITGYHNLKAVVHELVHFSFYAEKVWTMTDFALISMRTSYRCDTPMGTNLIILLLLLFVISYKWLVNHQHLLN